MNWIKVNAKSLGAIIAVIVTNMLTDLLQGSQPWPQNRDEWIQYLATSIGAGVVTWSVRNKITQKQLDNDPNVVGGVVVPDSQVPPETPETPISPPPVQGYTNPYRNDSA